MGLIETPCTGPATTYIFRFWGRDYTVWVDAVCTENKVFGVFSAMSVSNYCDVLIAEMSSWMSLMFRFGFEIATRTMYVYFGAFAFRNTLFSNFSCWYNAHIFTLNLSSNWKKYMRGLSSGGSSGWWMKRYSEVADTIQDTPDTLLDRRIFF